MFMYLVLTVIFTVGIVVFMGLISNKDYTLVNLVGYTCMVAIAALLWPIVLILIITNKEEFINWLEEDL